MLTAGVLRPCRSNQIWRSGTKSWHTQALAWFDRGADAWMRIEWLTLMMLYEEDQERFPVLNFLSHDHLV